MSYSYTDPDNRAAGDPTALAAAITATRNGDDVYPEGLDDRPPVRTNRAPGAHVADTLRDIDQQFRDYGARMPRGTADGIELPALTVWRDADAQLMQAHDDAHDLVAKIRVAVITDEQVAVDAVSSGKAIPPPTAAKVEADAIEAARRYKARVSLAEQAAAAVADALADHWRHGWRDELVAAEAAAKTAALACRDQFTAALARLQSARAAIVNADARYGSADYDGQLISDPVKIGQPGWMNPPKWAGLRVVDMLRNNLGRMNYEATTIGDLGAVEKFILADLANLHWSPGVEQPDDEPEG